MLHIPSHHDTYSPHLVGLQRFWISNLSPTIRGFEFIPGDEKELQIMFLGPQILLGGEIQVLHDVGVLSAKIIFPRDSTLLSARIWIGR